MIGTVASVRRRGSCRALSLLEVVLAMGVMSVVLVAVVNTLGATARQRQVRLEQARAVVLAQDLMEEILGQEYEEPFELLSFGPEPSEVNGTRSAFDDIDDYHEWNTGTSPHPPERRDGAVMPGLADWSRSVAVEYVSPYDVAGPPGINLGVKRVTVEVSKDGVVRRALVMIRTAAWVPPPYE